VEKGIKQEIEEKSLAIVIRALSIDLENNSESLSLTIDQLISGEIEAIDTKLKNMDDHLTCSFAACEITIKKIVQRLIIDRQKALRDYINEVTLENNRLPRYIAKIDDQAKADKRTIALNLSGIITDITCDYKFNNRAKKYVLSNFLPNFVDKITNTFKNRNETLRNNATINLNKISLIKSKVLIK
jgi:hypothetical protein